MSRWNIAIVQWIIILIPWLRYSSMQHAFVKHKVHVVELKEFLYFNMIYLLDL